MKTRINPDKARESPDNVHDTELRAVSMRQVRFLLSWRRRQRMTVEAVFEGWCWLTVYDKTLLLGSVTVNNRPRYDRVALKAIVSKSVNGCNGDSFREHCVLEGDRIPLLKGHSAGTETLFPWHLQ